MCRSPAGSVSTKPCASVPSELAELTAAIAWVWAQPHDVRLSVGKDPYWWTVNARAGFDRLTPEEKRPWIDIAREGDRQIREDNARLQAEREGEGP